MIWLAEVFQSYTIRIHLMCRCVKFTNKIWANNVCGGGKHLLADTNKIKFICPSLLWIGIYYCMCIIGFTVYTCAFLSCMKSESANWALKRANTKNHGSAAKEEYLHWPSVICIEIKKKYLLPLYAPLAVVYVLHATSVANSASWRKTIESNTFFSQ